VWRLANDGVAAVGSTRAMRALATRRFERSYADAPLVIQKAADKQLRLLLANLRHPSLNAKKYPESGDPELWQARVTKNWRLYFKIQGDAYVLVDMIEHPR
jgi:plasmid maintenance system killer protein